MGRASSVTRQELRHTYSDFQCCQLAAAWPQVSHFRFPNIMRSWKNEFFLIHKNIYRHKNKIKLTPPRKPRFSNFKEQATHTHKTRKSESRVFSQVFTVTQVKIPNYVPERGQQNRGCKWHPNIHKGAVTRTVLYVTALEAGNLDSSVSELLRSTFSN